MTLRKDAIYSGRVQGVGFRATVLHIARKYRVTGFVRNRPDGTVELIVEGEEPEVEALLAVVREHFTRNLTGESSHGSEPRGEFTGFEIRS